MFAASIRNRACFSNYRQPLLDHERVHLLGWGSLDAPMLTEGGDAQPTR
jgi:hypothetical protein